MPLNGSGVLETHLPSLIKQIIEPFLSIDIVVVWAAMSSWTTESVDSHLLYERMCA